MKRTLHLFAAALLILPASWLIRWSIPPLYALWTDQVVGSFGLHLRLGPLPIPYPWADAFILLCALVSLSCGLAIAIGNRHKIVLFFVGTSMFTLIALGVVGECSWFVEEDGATEQTSGGDPSTRADAGLGTPQK